MVTQNRVFISKEKSKLVPSPKKKINSHITWGPRQPGRNSNFRYRGMKNGRKSGKNQIRKTLTENATELDTIGTTYDAIMHFSSSVSYAILSACVHNHAPANENIICILDQSDSRQDKIPTPFFDWATKFSILTSDLSNFVYEKNPPKYLRHFCSALWRCKYVDRNSRFGGSECWGKIGIGG